MDKFEREHELRDLADTHNGKLNVLRLYCSIKGLSIKGLSETELHQQHPKIEKVIDEIIEHEFPETS